ncbi:uncharacterized protein M421DRAFT_10247 [Didymella exigua CBS 183.55]|uniref:PQ-loop-domain-containing protein n=1 Tax=Didymella exigua CBS 183.55 TaxID=1150837 RepID=A0A6A5RAE6_9PLEO|nr:uncharacterized protein M421DRAFT_10247 [Didymella exigua CBS 183.55]KAF1922787.1 hypothetical protein M421DRAFT_10247 [Didymella exigua CBS 183.55]
MDKPQVSIPPAADVLGVRELLTIDYRNNTDVRLQLYRRLVPCMHHLPSLSRPVTNTATSSAVGVFRSFHSGVPFGVYAIVQNFSFALQFQPQAFAALTLISWGQTLYYHNKWKAWTATVATILLATSFGVMEVILIFALQGPYDRGVKWPMMLMAISATLIQIAGLIPPYFELAKRNGRVIGIDFWFLLIDYAGALFSLMALVAQQWFDSLGGSLYIACMLLETGIVASQVIWLWRVRHIRKEAKKAGKTYDEYVAENPSKRIPRSGSSETVVDVEAGYKSKSHDDTRENTNTKPTEKSESHTAVKGSAAGPPAEQRGLKQKWCALVLRPIPDT